MTDDNLNLIVDPWIPVVRRSGLRAVIRPADIVDAHATDPVVRIATPRPDFNGAILQFLIGLLTTVAAPEHVDDWEDALEQPPSPDELHRKLLTVSDAFNLLGPGPRFMQDAAPLGNPDKSPHQLLIDAPGDQTIRHNKDFFFKRVDGYPLGLPAAAMALLTLQLNAPSGGAGHRTSLRGGGPITTVWVGETLWASSWGNVPSRLEWPVGDISDARDRFPWMGGTRTSAKGELAVDFSLDRQLLHFWSMPRRIRLHAERTSGPCSILGDESEVRVTGYATVNYGENYGVGWSHPLTPHYQVAGQDPVPIKGSTLGADGVVYDDWLGLILTDSGDKRTDTPAMTVRRGLRLMDRHRLRRVHVFGYRLDNMKAEFWSDAVLPVPHVPAERSEDFSAAVTRYVRASRDARRALISALRRVMGSLRESASGREEWRERGDRGATLYRAVEREFLSTTDAPFRDVLEREASAATHDLTVAEQWHRVLVSTCDQLYLRTSEHGEFRAADPKAVVLARRYLRQTLNGKEFRQQLGLPPVGGNESTRRTQR